MTLHCRLIVPDEFLHQFFLTLLTQMCFENARCSMWDDKSYWLLTSKTKMRQFYSTVICTKILHTHSTTYLQFRNVGTSFAEKNLWLYFIINENQIYCHPVFALIYWFNKASWSERPSLYFNGYISTIYIVGKKTPSSMRLFILPQLLIVWNSGVTTEANDTPTFKAVLKRWS